MDMYNMRVFNYGDSFQVRLYSKPVVSGVSRETPDSTINAAEPISDDIIRMRAERSITSSLNRTKNKLYGIARANEWDLFITLTFDRNITDSSDYDLISRRTRNWLNNIQKRYCPDLKYLVVPELHADRIHWHIHGLLANISGLKMLNTGIVKNGKSIYNLRGWKFGFSTASYVVDSARCASYICKYITKELVTCIKNRKRFWASSNCTRIEDVTENYFIDSQRDFFKSYGSNIDYVKSVNVLNVNDIKYLELKL